MKFRYTIAAIFFSVCCLFTTALAQDKLKLHFKDKSVIEYFIENIDSISFEKHVELPPVLPSEKGPYTPTFKATNASEGIFTQFEKCKDRLFAAGIWTGVVEYKGGQWIKKDFPTGNYPIIKAFNNRIFIANEFCVYVEKENSNETEFDAYLWDNDMAGALGGSEKSFFAGAGTNANGIYRFVDNQFVLTNQTVGTWYSIDALGDDVFFGSGGTHVHYANPGVVRWDEQSQMIHQTNLTNGTFNVVSYKGMMFAGSLDGVDGNTVYKWNGNEFQKIFDANGQVKKTGDSLYLLSGTNIYVYNDLTSSFDFFYSPESYISDIAEYDNKVYIFYWGLSKVYDKDTKIWEDITDMDCGNLVTLAYSCDKGVFVGNNSGNPNASIGILQMVPKYHDE